MFYWCNNPVTMLEQPAGSQLRLTGIYNEPSEVLDTIIIRLEIATANEDDTVEHKVLYRHNPKIGSNEDPDKDIISLKYSTHVKKIAEKLSKTKYKDLP